jgi:2-amino-4-hydroxy-6-hydroxymethyldihydropteridine diphosphokinase
MVNVYIGIGSNLGDKKENIRKSIKFMEEKCKIIKVSSLYKTEPIGYKNQDWFLNCTIKAETELKPLELLRFLQSIEKKLGRIRTIKNGPRTIDLDILFYNKKVINKRRLIIPHPRLHERAFVLDPLKEIAANFIHPVLKKPINELNSTKKYDN